MMGTEKLVRDKIPELMKKTGTNPNVRIVKNQELDVFLRKKIVEEAKELFETGDIEELADLYEVLDAFVKHRKIDSGLLEMQRLAKNLARGAFSNGVVLDME